MIHSIVHCKGGP